MPSKLAQHYYIISQYIDQLDNNKLVYNPDIHKSIINLCDTYLNHCNFKTTQISQIKCLNNIDKNVKLLIYYTKTSLLYSDLICKLKIFKHDLNFYQFITDENRFM